MEELEYHVTFPTNFSKSKLDEDESKKTGESSIRSRAIGIAADMTSAPVIFLLGWSGCQDKHLAKYSSIYQSNGYITIRYTLPNEYFYSKKKGATRDVALKVLEAFFDLGLEENPIFFHVFSNGGGYVYRHITEIVNGENPGQSAALKIAGVLCDSVPCRVSAATASRVVSAMSRTQHWIIAFIKSFGVWIFFLVLSFFSYVFGGGSSERTTYFGALCRDKMQCPQLFLYSKKDEVVPFQEIQEVMKERRLRGFDVQEVVFEDSKHVSHLQKHPEDYVSACLKFVRDCSEKVA